MSSQEWEPLVSTEFVVFLRMGDPPSKLLEHLLCPDRSVLPPTCSDTASPSACPVLLDPPISYWLLSIQFSEDPSTVRSSLATEIPSYLAYSQSVSRFYAANSFVRTQVTNGHRHLCLSVMQRVENCARRWKLTWAQRTKRSNYSITSKYTWSFSISKSVLKAFIGILSEQRFLVKSISEWFFPPVFTIIPLKKKIFKCV